MKIMIIGADGQLGADLVSVFQKNTDIEVIPMTLQTLDITRVEQTKDVLQRYRPDCLVNTAAYIKVDLSETEMEKTFQVNTYPQKHLSAFCREMGIHYCLISTDYVFDGQQETPYVESDAVRPVNVYGISKLAGEQIVQYSMENYSIVRISGLYGRQKPMGKPDNFVDMILKRAKAKDVLRVVDDQRVSPTHALDVARQLLALLLSKNTGVFHVTSQGSCSWYDFAREALRLCGYDCALQRAKTGDFGELAIRPSNSVLQNKHLQEFGLDLMPQWQDALREYLMLEGHIRS